MNAAGQALREVAAELRMHGPFNDLSVGKAFGVMAKNLERRADEIEAESKPVPSVPATPASATSVTPVPAATVIVPTPAAK